MTRERKELGLSGEELALRFLLGRGLRLEQKNYRIRSGEIDLVMWDGDVLVFVEVRTRSDSFFGQPVETVRRTKQQKIIGVARHFLHSRKISQEIRCRFDMVGIVIKQGREPEIDYIENAFFVGD
ncbi:MAG: YraN family protein [Candidatus Rifleibacteriota bacterium]